jgi:hypothetical protein
MMHQTLPEALILPGDPGAGRTTARTSTTGRTSTTARTDTDTFTYSTSPTKRSSLGLLW